ncbi:1,4-alpha-glucan branching protein GlgB [Kineobactrum salinum]|uniref:1,4-alpha-glucan branching enzyme GlgB n=2 Tax=Kineobactrum salinum TaxID=2708301 RepID=A0A6C0U6Q9_9GAMM|nr:1,4-alpha-glucan branching protein GlgB [Kineobactrum salinum]QIB67573.1 1,4-alpha-glucan branching protein GlgB [Kineobactrum salinum]
MQGRHPDSFAVLGLHRQPGGSGLVARALLPWARSVTLVARDGDSPPLMLQRLHPEGLFEAVVEHRQQPFDYYWQVETGHGTVALEDPYRFASAIRDEDFYYFSEGTEEFAWRKLGAHPRRLQDIDGVLFTVWAPAALRVSVVGDFNGWDGRQHAMRRHPASGIWELFVPAVADLAHYKYEIVDASGHLLPQKADPYGGSMQHPPETASRVQLGGRPYRWGDADWMARRDAQHRRPVSIYEVHPASWRRREQDNNRYLSYLELADELIPYALDQGFTHLQLMPINEYPFDGSWGYQPVGLYAPTIRFGTPDEFRHFVDRCHQQQLGVLLDWVPGHFPSDPHGLGRFDGSALYEHDDPRLGFHPDWNTFIYNYGRGEVASFLLSNANYWLEEFHLDGLRVDAVASMLYLDYSREPGGWLPNVRGGRENLEAIAFLQRVNERVHARHPGVMMVAEESTAWPGVSRPVHAGGLGFGFKWNMGWMNDSLRYIARDPIHRGYHHDELTFGLVYAWQENFILCLSHDEVVHGKRSLLNKMPGDEWQQFANLRAYLGFMWGHPGKKLLFMGGEFGQRREWNHDRGLDWQLLQQPLHRGLQSLVRDLNRLYRSLPALHELDCDPAGFQWLQADRRDISVFAWLRRGENPRDQVLVLVNLTPGVHHDYRVGVPAPGRYRECLNTDALDYGGSGQGNLGGVEAVSRPWDGQPCSLLLTVPPLATVVLSLDAGAGSAAST